MSWLTIWKRQPRDKRPEVKRADDIIKRTNRLVEIYSQYGTLTEVLADQPRRNYGKRQDVRD